MPYELTLRLKSATPVCGQLLLSKLLLAGLRVRPDAVPPGLFGDGLARFEVITDPAAPAGVSVSVKIPNGRTFVDVTIELLHLERLAGFIEADVMDGDEVMVHSGQKGLAALFAFHARYEQASHGAPPALEVA